MLIVLGADSNDEYDNENYDFAVVDLGESEARKLMALAKLFDDTKQAEAGLRQMSFEPAELGVKCSFYTNIWSFTDDPDNASVKFPDDITGVMQEDHPYAIVPDDFKLPFDEHDALKPEDLEIQVNEFGFSWAAYPENSTVVIWTRILPRDLLAKII